MTRRFIALGLAVLLLAAACGSDSDDEETSAEDTTTEETATAEPEEAATEEPTEEAAESETPEATEAPEETATPEADEWADVTGAAPGVTDDSVKIGLAYVDSEALNSAIGSSYDFGDQEAAYLALIDSINAAGGIHGRQLDPVIEAVNPVNPIGAEEACTKLTQDDEVFVVSGFWFRDTVLCPVDLNETAAVGGEQSPERIEQAKAPWVSWEPDTELPAEVVRTFEAEGLLDGSVAVFVTAGDAALMEDLVLPTLEEVGVEPVAVGVQSAPSDDVAAVRDEVLLIGESFETAGADTVLIVGLEGVQWPRYMQEVPSYRPQLLFVDVRAGGSLSDVSDAAAETLEGSIAGGSFGPDQAAWEEQTMQDCIAILEAAGIEVPEPDKTPEDDPNNTPYSAAFNACKDLTLTGALLEAAGPNLNYGTVELAIEEGFEVALPGDPTPRTYGPPPAGDGDPAAYLFVWDNSERDFVRMEG